MWLVIFPTPNLLVGWFEWRFSQLDGWVAERHSRTQFGLSPPLTAQGHLGVPIERTEPSSVQGHLGVPMERTEPSSVQGHLGV